MQEDVKIVNMKHHRLASKKAIYVIGHVLCIFVHFQQNGQKRTILHYSRQIWNTQFLFSH